MKRSIFALLFAVGLSVSAQAQQMVRYIAEGPTFPVHEVGVIFAEKQGKVIADLILPEGALPKGYTSQGIQKDDQLVMVNGAGIKTAKELQDIYKKLDVGATVKLGLKRGEEKVLVTFAKVDPNDLPKRKMVKKVMGEDGKEKEVEENE